MKKVNEVEVKTNIRASIPFSKEIAEAIASVGNLIAAVFALSVENGDAELDRSKSIIEFVVTVNPPREPENDVERTVRETCEAFSLNLSDSERQALKEHLYADPLAKVIFASMAEAKMADGV